MPVSRQHAGWQGPAALPTGWLLCIGIILLWIYGSRMAIDPLTWEEPRRCLVALEMIARGDYIVPYVLGEPYRNKPPLQNWLIVLFAGNRVHGVGPVPIRLISLLSLLGTSWCLWRFARGQQTPCPAWMPVLIFLTMGIVVQYGRSGELDPLFTFWVVAALGCFDAGRRRRAVWLQWGLSQALLAGGILTKGLAPVFFYPPVLYCAWQDRKQVPVPPGPVLLGLALEGTIVSAWLVPYAWRTSAAMLGRQWSEELLARTPVSSSALALVAHVVSFPLEILGAMLPWSLVLGLCLLPQVRGAMRSALRQEPSLRLAAAVSLWSTGLLWLMPGAKGRYLFPALAFMATLLGHILASAWAAAQDTVIGKLCLDRRTPWLALGLCWGGGVALTAVLTGHTRLWQPLVVGLLAIAATAYGVRTTRATGPFFLLLLTALLYGIVYTGVSRAMVAAPEMQRVQAAHTIAAAIAESRPVVCDTQVSYRDCFEISRRVGRALYRHRPPSGDYLLVTSLHHGTPARGELLAQAAPLALWKVAPE